MREDTVTRPGHPDEPLHRLVIEHPGAALVLAVDGDERVCCIRQYRHVVGHNVVGLPAGVCDVPGEDPIETARRELREEAELEADHWLHLLSLFACAGTSQEQHHIYLARGLSAVSRGDFVLEHEEAELEVFWVAFDELLEAALRGDVRDAPLVSAVLAYDALRRRDELQARDEL